MPSPVGSNWAGTHEYTARRLIAPQSLDELVEAVTSSRRIKALGTRHSFNDIADNDADLVTLVDLPAEPRIDRDRSTVSVASGTRFGVLAKYLHENGYALHNLGSLPHISIAGACATGTHGSGDGNANLASAVAALEMVDGRGQVLMVSRTDPDFGGMVIGLGALGIVTRMTLDIQPTYAMRQDVYLELPFASYLDHFDEISSAGYSVSVFTDWSGPTMKQVWLKRRLGADNALDGGDQFEHGLFGAWPAGSKVMSPADEGHDNTTAQGGVPGPWSERLPHFRPDATPSNGNEIQTEYFVDRQHARGALQAVQGIAAQIAPHLLVSELRTVARDSLWLSPTRDADCLAIHFTWKMHPVEVTTLLPIIENALAPFDPRPHWGKWFSMTATELAPKYPQMEHFHSLAEALDPQRRFRNAYLQRAVGLEL